MYNPRSALGSAEYDGIVWAEALIVKQSSDTVPIAAYRTFFSETWSFCKRTSFFFSLIRRAGAVPPREKKCIERSLQYSGIRAASSESQKRTQNNEGKVNLALREQVFSERI